MNRIRPGIDFPYHRAIHCRPAMYPQDEPWAQRKARARWLTGDDGATHREKRLLAALRASGWDVFRGVVNGYIVPNVLRRVEDELEQQTRRTARERVKETAPLDAETA